MRAIVIGGGIGGLAAAAGLWRAGIEVEVYEQARELRELGAGLTLWPNAVAALKRLGLERAVGGIAVPNVQGGIYDPSGRPLVELPVAELDRRLGGRTIVAHRAELQSAMLDEVGPQRVRLDKRCVDFRQTRAGVTALFADGSSAEGDLLIGADGTNSVVRAGLHGEREPLYAGYNTWRAVVSFDAARSMAGETWGRGMRFGRVPMGEGRVYWFAAKNAPAGERSRGGEKAELLRLFGGWHEPVAELIAATGEQAIMRHDIFDRPALKRWGAGRVTLLGDAAHAMTPNLGQGACQALEDAAVLASCLAGAGEADVGRALRCYERRRMRRTESIIRGSRLLGQVAQWESPAAVWLRDSFVRLLGAEAQYRSLERVAKAGDEAFFACG